MNGPSTRGRYRRRKKHHVLASILTKTGSARYSTTFRKVVAARLGRFCFEAGSRLIAKGAP